MTSAPQNRKESGTSFEGLLTDFGKRLIEIHETTYEDFGLIRVGVKIRPSYVFSSYRYYVERPRR